ncbi:hypothetical protein C1M51_04780 [Methylibium sp. Pch-M]|uniref:DUF2924 domain-containing protein n=1 Tax=Methylibium sp. Pch-M TaxID=2082386 RepID=UPI0010129792|nr:DUF2924 domain-containing protein [Methylibium sp. Pch-M]QAZ38799.1 hypothetical protein C1M51_04780 [Methylibium sp. Pch-M]
METVSVEIDAALHGRLTKIGNNGLFQIPLVISQLVDHWEKTALRPSSLLANRQAENPSPWKSSRGNRFPVGLQLTAYYLGKTHNAVVTGKGIEFNGNYYDNPSTAAMAVKMSAGTPKKSAATNGWRFWLMPCDDGSNRLTSIDKLRRSNGQVS